VFCILSSSYVYFIQIYFHNKGIFLGRRNTVRHTVTGVPNSIERHEELSATIRMFRRGRSGEISLPRSLPREYHQPTVQEIGGGTLAVPGASYETCRSSKS
jgi:hypothetical protein